MIVSKYNAHATCWPSVVRPADGQRVSLGALVERAKAPRWYACKELVWRWSAARYRDNYRNRASFLTEHAIVRDVGDYPGGVQREQLERAVAGVLGFAYTTWLSTHASPRYRVVRMLSREIDADEHDRVARYVAELEEGVGIVPDVANDAPHAWACPARHDGDAYEFIDFDGEPLDVETALDRFPKPEPLPAPDRGARDESYARRFLRARKYLENMPGAIQGSNGSATTFKAACAMVRGFQLEPHDALNLLAEVHNPLCKPEWSKRELAHKVRQAFQRSRLPFGWLANRPRDVVAP
jgi:hypothetical protein